MEFILPESDSSDILYDPVYLTAFYVNNYFVAPRTNSANLIFKTFFPSLSFQTSCSALLPLFILTPLP